MDMFGGIVMRVRVCTGICVHVMIHVWLCVNMHMNVNVRVCVGVCVVSSTCVVDGMCWYVVCCGDT